MCELFMFLMGMWADVKKKKTYHIFWWFGGLATRLVRLSSRIDVSSRSVHLVLDFAWPFADHFSFFFSLFVGSDGREIPWQQTLQVCSSNPRGPTNTYAANSYRCVWALNSILEQAASSRSIETLGIYYRIANAKIIRSWEKGRGRGNMFSVAHALWAEE